MLHCIVPATSHFRDQLCILQCVILTIKYNRNKVDLYCFHILK